MPPAPRRRPLRSSKRRVRLDNDERRAQLLALAKQAFSDRSYDEVSIDDLAHALSISKGLLYHYFPTKRDLYVAGLRQIADDLVAAISRVADSITVPIDRVRGGIDAYLDFVQSHARAFVSLMRGGIGSDPEVVSVVEGVRTQLFERFLHGSPFMPLLAGNARFEVAVRGWLGFVEHASINWCTKPTLPRDELRELFVQILFEVIRTVSPPVFGRPSALEDQR